MECLWCKSEFTAKRAHARFCSTQCRSNHYSWRQTYIRIVDEVPCAYCGNLFERTADTIKDKHCSAKCRVAHDRARKTVTKPCAYCGNEFTTYGNARYCSNSCHKAGFAQTLGKANCRHCGQEFQKRQKNQVDCSYRCSNAAWDIRARGMRKAVMIDKDITLAAVAKICNYNCGICGQPVDMTRRRPDGGSPSLDHIMPVSKGGTHSWDNVQLAHWRCNHCKGNRINDTRRIA